MGREAEVSSKTPNLYHVISWKVGDTPTIVRSTKSRASAYNKGRKLSMSEGFVIVEKHNKKYDEYEQMIFFGGVLLQENKSLTTILANV